MIAAAFALATAGFLVAARNPEPLSNPAEWITAEDYPRQAIVEEQIGNVDYKLSVNTAGEATGCHIVHSSGSSILDETTCTLLMRRAKFKRGGDLLGVGTMTNYNGTVRWRLPGIDPLAPMRSVVEFDVTPEGQIVRCKVQTTVPADDNVDGCSKLLIEFSGKLKAKPKGRHIRIIRQIEVSEATPPN